jgi:predicted transposase/invertase (TIGR01784 family)
MNYRIIWLFILRHLPDLEYQPSSLQENVFKSLFDTAQIAKLSQEERQAYENSLKYYRDMVGVVETAHEEGIQKGIQRGIQQGIQQGIEQGRRSEKLTIAQTMKQAGISLDLIAQVTGLSMEELQTLE